MILKIADSYLTTLTPSRLFELSHWELEHSKVGAYGFYEIDSPMDMPWLFRTASDRVTVIDQLQLEAVSG